MTAQHVRLAMDAVPGVTPITVDGVEYWVTGDPPPTEATEVGHLLPRFDEYLLGYKDRSLVLDPTYAKRVNAGGGMPSAIAYRVAGLVAANGSNVCPHLGNRLAENLQLVFKLLDSFRQEF